MWPLISSPRMSPAAASASSGASANFTPPAFIRPPVSTCDLMTTGPPPAAATRLASSAAAAGDIACAPGTATTASTCQQQATANLVNSNAPTAVAVLGDNQYNSGTYAEYTGAGAFGATWGAFKSLIHPALGNHEYGSTGTSQPSGYFDYFNGVGVDSGPAGNRGDGWYSYDLGVSHLTVLNSSNDCAP